MQDNQSQAQCALAYIAGIIDGEGSIMIGRSTHGRGRKTPSYTPRVRIQMTRTECMQFIVDHTGFGEVKSIGLNPKRPKCQELFKWEIHSKKDCYAFLELIYPYLVLKKPHADHLMDYCKRITNVKKCMDGVPLREKLFREESYHMMRKLNGRVAGATTKSSNTGDGEAIV